MSVKINYCGRFGNNLFQYVAAYLFAKKHNLSIKYDSTFYNSDLKKLPEHDIGFSFNDDNSCIVVDSNYIALMQLDKAPNAAYIFNGFFQLRELVEDYREDILSIFPPCRQELKDSTFIHYRIGDLEGRRAMLPYEYYKEALNKLNCNYGVISSDSPEHPNVLRLAKEFNLLVMTGGLTPMEIINFARPFRNIVLSEGTFSFWIGFLSISENVYYNERERFWHGDIFHAPNWIPLFHDYPKEMINPDNSLKIILCNN